MKRTRLVRLLSILAIAAVVVSMAPPALSSDAYSNREEVTAPLSERAQAADMVRLAADESLHAAMLGARKDWQSSEGLPVLDAPDPLPLDAPLTATWALTTPLAVEAMGGDFVASQSGPGEATPLSPPPMTGYEQTAGATYTYFQKISATDPLGRLSSVKDYMGTVGNNPGAACPAPAWTASPNGTTSYQYDVADRLTMTTAPDNAQIQISYDALGRKTQMSDPDMGTWSYAYDQVSNLTRQTDARGQTVCFYYDGLNRLRGKHTRNDTSCPTWASNPSLAAQYTYDAGSNGIGRRTGMTDGSGSASWVYDSRGRVTSETKVVSGTGGGTFITQWTAYDAMDRVRTMQYPDGEVVTLSYTSQGPLKGVSGTSVYVGDTLYNALGQVTDRYLGGATGQVRQKYTYTQGENFRLTGLQGGVSPNYNTLQNVTYSYDDQGNVLTVVDAAAFGGSQTQTFSYDALNRLLSAQAAGGSHGTYSQRSYVYNPAGNITIFEGAALGYNDAGHKHAVTHVAGVQRYWYDANGNATRRVNGSQDVTLVYDAENHVTSITGSGISATYVYDGDGQRVKAMVGGTTTVYIGNTYERDNGTTVRKYYYAGAVRVALRTGGNTFFLLNDHLTSTAITTNSSGVRQTELRYFAYGGTRYDAGGQLTLYRYTGQRVETGTGLYDYGARWYDPAIGRFLAADSIVPNPGDSQALNRYMYVLGNPVKYSDPSGHAACGADDRACWENEWTWKNRWYNAHGYFDNGNGWSAQGLPVYSDIGILLDTLAEVGVPTIRDILPGGAYGMGQILYGGIMLSIYRPPTVRVFTGQDTIRPIVGLWFGASISGGSQIVDDWFGDLCPSGTCTRPGTWGNVDIRISTQIPNVWEFVTGFAIGLGQSPESLPPGPDTTRAEMRGDLRATGLYGLNGALQEGRLNMFVLQQDAQDHLRLIILTRQFSDNRANYVTANGLYPVGVMPVCVQGW